MALINPKKRYEALLLYHLFAIIHKNFLIKANGGTDSLGNKWKPLKDRTRIYKPLTPAEKRRYPLRGRTKKEALANRQPLILILTRRLERSLKPGKVVGDKYLPNSEQIARINGTKVSVGTKVPYAGEVSKVRPAIPYNIDPWITEASKKAIQQMSTEK